ncbi:MAG: GNAT family N-acetyltransferase [Polyangia bacterium]
MRLRFVHVAAAAIGPYVPALRRLEQAITYPISDGANGADGADETDRFFIDHGADYHPFFSRLGEAHFVLALDEERSAGRPEEQVIGALAGVLRRAEHSGRSIPSVYLCDLKLHADYRGQDVVPRLLRFALGLVRQPRFQRWRLAYGAAMRGRRGDVMRSARGLSLLRLGSTLGQLTLYFVPPERLAALQPRTAPTPPDAAYGLDLSPEVAERLVPPGTESTAGRKDLRLVSTGEPWPLVHLPRSIASPGYAEYLVACGRALAPQGGLACFAIDERLTDWNEWLRRAGLSPGALCTVYGLRLVPSLYSARWVHLATSEI